MKELEHVILVKLNRKTDGKPFVKKYKLNGAPGFLLMDADGKVNAQWLGYNKDEFIQKLKSGLETAKGS